MSNWSYRWLVISFAAIAIGCFGFALSPYAQGDIRIVDWPLDFYEKKHFGRQGENMGKSAGEDAEKKYFNEYNTRWIEWKNPAPLVSFDRPDLRFRSTPTLLWLGNFEFFDDDTAPAKPNCSEEKLSLEQIMGIARDPKVNSTLDFLQRLPKDSLQKFTFMYESKSLQKDVSFRFPRVIRFSTDGGLAISYTCDPNEWSYNTVEVLAFNDASRRYQLVHFDFPHEAHPDAEIFERTHKKIVMNHKSCLACHGGADPRTNWAAYDTWRGAYGSQDDRIGSIDRQGQFTWQVASFGWHRNPQIQVESGKYKEFRELQKDNPCYASLPWPAQNPHYPYIPIEKQMNYNYRPNAHYTIISARRNAQRLARKFTEHPNWDRMKYAIAAWELGCGSTYQRLLNEALVGVAPPISDVMLSSLGENYFKDDHSQGFLGPFPLAARHLGITNGSDWTNQFIDGKAPYDSGDQLEVSSAQWSMDDFVFSVVMRDLSKSDPELAAYDFRINRMSNLFGRNFTCVDEVADKFFPVFGTERLCEILKDRHARAIRLPLPTRRFQREALFPERPRFRFSTVSNGKEIVNKTCGACHDGQVLKYNFADETVLRRQIAYFSEGMIALVEMKLGTSETCEMPLKIAGPCLSNSERSAVLKYLRSLKPAE